ncbi:hypothetical protein HG536_0D02840 [Torulaspora globosa]|uniref:Processing of GAS1 and ALP protein 2 n=1 Tax=Torulaspora globosa TaxID=48254 RepID=A0A7G3ZGX6_9SACH|nr:uncharacterized protein HG536_0D02840 [Torulaspora globosa]QLL32762.1 hypothetical protein HG536_0D02840 [Torulaspora globosa]
MELVDRVRNNFYDTFADMSSTKAVRLVVIVGGYILIRNLVSRELAKRKLQSQIRKDERELSDNKGKELIDNPEADATTSSIEYGWGNRTRQKIKKQEDMLAKMVEHAQIEKDRTEDDLSDIQDLLEE